MEAAQPALPVELMEEILLRLPPDEPAWLLRASLVCKSWGSAISHPSFRRRLHELHGVPPVLGFLHDSSDKHISHFIPTTASSFSLPAPDRRIWRAVDCRHGRALFLSSQELLVWEPITGGERRVPVPAAYKGNYVSNGRWSPTAAVLCAADGCDHRDCHGGPFQLVFVFYALVNTVDYEEYRIFVCPYSSETGTWGEATLVEGNFMMNLIGCSSVLAGRSLLYFMSDGFILEYDLAIHGLTVFHAEDIDSTLDLGKFNLVLAEDGGMRVCQELLPHLRFWKMDGPDAKWVLSRVINLGNLLQIGDVDDEDTRVSVVAFAEGANVIFVETADGIFTVELKSEKVRKVSDKRGFFHLVPVVSFYTPVFRVEHQDLLSSGLSENAAGGEEEKALEQPQQLFDKGYNAIEEERDLINALKTRIRSHGEAALDCASTDCGCALLYKAQAMDDPLDNIPKSASNEESVTGATSKEDAGNSKTSGSNVEDAAPP